MAEKQKMTRTRHSNNVKLIRQKQARRRNSLRKSFEYCLECDADDFIMIRFKRNGQITLQITFFNSNAQWPLSREQLVRIGHQLVAIC